MGSKAARANAPAREAVHEAARKEAEQMAVKAISQLTDASANERRVEATAHKLARLRTKLQLASQALKVAQDGRKKAQEKLSALHDSGGSTRDAILGVKSWDASFKERDAKYSELNHKLETETWKLELSKVQTKHLLAGDTSPGSASKDVEALELKHQLSAIAAADARQVRERTELRTLKDAYDDAKS